MTRSRLNLALKSSDESQFRLLLLFIIICIVLPFIVTVFRKNVIHIITYIHIILSLLDFCFLSVRQKTFVLFY